jgi:hypothetical protein
MYGLEGYFKQVGISADKNDWTRVRIMHGDLESKKEPLDELTYPDPRYPNRPLHVSRFIIRERLMKTPCLHVSQMTGARCQFAMNGKDGGTSL